MAPAPKRRLADAAKTETSGNIGKVTKSATYSSGAPKRGTQARADILKDMRALVKSLRTAKWKSMAEKKKAWAQVDNYRVALGTLKEKDRKSKSQHKVVGTTTYGGGKFKVGKEAGFSVDAGRGGGRKSTQRPGGGKATSTTKKPASYNRRPVFVNVGAASDFMPFDGAHAEPSKNTRPVVSKNSVRMPAEKAKQGESRKDYINRKYKQGLAAGGTRGR